MQPSLNHGQPPAGPDLLAGLCLDVDILFSDPPLNKRAKSKRTRSKTIVPEITGGLFELVETINEERFFAVYHSGASAYYDLLGLTQARKDVGVVADLLQPRTIGVIRNYLREGGQAFVDSGAYSAFQRWRDGKAGSRIADFEAVFRTYDELSAGLDTQDLRRLALVMPDIVGDPEGSLTLLDQYRETVLRFIATGINAIVPIQKGRRKAGETVEAVAEILGTRDFTVGIPSASAAMALPDVATIRGHNRFHVLGRASMRMELFRRAYAFLENNIGAQVSCDGTLLRKNTTPISQIQAEMIAANEGCIWEGTFDDTELLFDVLHTNRWMTGPQVKALASFYGVCTTREQRQWINQHREGEGALAPLIEERDPEAMRLVEYGLNRVFRGAAEAHLSARLRAVAVAEVFGENGESDRERNDLEVAA